jgi:hypothetical protein
MAERFVEVDRNTPMLLPAELRDWVAEDDLVHFVIEAVKTLPTPAVCGQRAGYRLRSVPTLDDVGSVDLLLRQWDFLQWPNRKSNVSGSRSAVFDRRYPSRS